MGFCKILCQGLLIVIPIFVGWFVTGYGEGPHSVRQVGLTEFALPENYDEFKITEQHREEFFRDGASLLKGVLRPSMVAKLRAVVERRQPQLTPPTSSNLWMDSDELLDFYLFGPLGGIAAQLFQSRDAVTSHLAPSAQLQGDFISKRYQEATNGWHIDRTECQGGDQPSKFMSTALPRLAIPLDAQAVRGTQIINQSKYAAALSAKDAELYWAGKAPYRREGRFEPFYGFEYNTSVPILPGITLKEDMIMEHWVEPGDVVIFNTCLWHRSPDWAGPEPELGLQPTFAPSSHVPKDPPQVKDLGGSWCNHGLGDKSIAGGSPCFPTAFPEEARPKKGSTLAFQRYPTPQLRHVLASYLRIRITDKLRRFWLSYT